jgi:hypothetical protein
MGTSGPGPWRISLSKNQIRAARTLFLHWFWNAETEAWVDRGKLQWRTAGTPPFDTLAPREDGPIALLGDQSRPPIDVALVLGDSVPSEATELRRLWIDPTSPNNPHLISICAEGVEIVWQDLELPQMQLGKTGLATTRCGDSLLSVQLSSKQQADAERILRMGDPQWQLRTSVTIGELQSLSDNRGQFIPVQQPEERIIHKSVAVQLGTLRPQSLDDVESCAPETFPAPPSMTLRVEYTWDIEIPRPPAEAVPDRLVQEWRQLDDFVVASRDAARVVLESIELHRESHKEAPEWVGVVSKQAALQSELAQLENGMPSTMDPVKARQLIDSAREVHEKCAALRETAERIVSRAEQAEDELRARDEFELRRVNLTSDLQRIDERILPLEQEEALLRERSQSQSESRQDRRAAGKGLKDVSSSLQKARNQKFSKQQQLEEPFKFIPKAARVEAKKPGGFVPPPDLSSAVRIPSESLPAIGDLLSAGDVRYLAISTWEELPQGQREAVRLSAILVAKGE